MDFALNGISIFFTQHQSEVVSVHKYSKGKNLLARLNRQPGLPSWITLNKQVFHEVLDYLHRDSVFFVNLLRGTTLPNSNVGLSIDRARNIEQHRDGCLHLHTCSRQEHDVDDDDDILSYRIHPLISTKRERWGQALDLFTRQSSLRSLSLNFRLLNLPTSLSSFGFEEVDFVALFDSIGRCCIGKGLMHLRFFVHETRTGRWASEHRIPVMDVTIEELQRIAQSAVQGPGVKTSL
ncbi:unnamed protein product [Periconia digitata]|uniref:Uncharacterized protein n=1 Tax=Periconia digitata TaxID=1303443 RepID=A0A9W4UBJ4_9PLEO|nr:unnamed protein product [Periconia digitata]